MSRDLWKTGVPARERRADGNFRHSQAITTFGPGALVDLVDDAAIVAGLAWWAKGPPIAEDRLVAMLARQPGFERITLASPPASSPDLEDPNRKWIKAFRFPEWFVCQNERCWDDADQPPRKDGARPRRLLRISELDGQGKNQGHKCKGGKGKTSPVQPIRWSRACRFGHIDDIDWRAVVHRKKLDCRRHVLWLDEAGPSGELADVRITCSGCGENVRMSLLAQRALLAGDDKIPPLGFCSGKRPWLGGGNHGDEACSEWMRLLLRSASYAYFSVVASVIHIPDPDAHVRDQITPILPLIGAVKSAAMIAMLREIQEPVRIALEGIADEVAFAEVERLRDARPVARKTPKEAEIEVLQNPPERRSSDKRFSAWPLVLPKARKGVMASVSQVVLVPRLTEVRALAGFTRFEARTSDIDGEVDIGAEVAKLDEPLTWLPTVESPGEGFFFALDEARLRAWEEENLAVVARQRLFTRGFEVWQAQREDRKRQRPDFTRARFLLLHSLSHLLITAVSLECGYSASSVRERIYAGKGGSGILLYTASAGAEGSLGGLVEVGRHLDRYLEHALELGRLCSNDPVCSAHAPDTDTAGSDRYLEGASCHGCLLISEPSCERMNVYLDRTFVVPTIESTKAAFFP
jgi:hypothetical protein